MSELEQRRVNSLVQGKVQCGSTIGTWVLLVESLMLSHWTTVCHK